MSARSILPKGRHHLIGIGGISMSGLALWLLDQGVEVSGSDQVASPLTARLASLGATVHLGHRAHQVEGAARVVVSDAIAADNPELLRARELGLPVIPRSQLLAEALSSRHTIAVAGSHGKTTTAAMIALCLVRAGRDPLALVGGEVAALGGNARLGHGEWAVAEACEAYNSFLALSPEIAVVTNLEPDHLDVHGTFEALQGRFREFLERVPPGGRAVINLDDPNLPAVARGVPSVVGFSAAGRGIPALRLESVYRASRVELTDEGASFLLEHGEQAVGRVELAIPGLHNVLNGLAASAACLEAGVQFSQVRAALAGFGGVARRFQLVGQARGVTIIDDYAHHPTEIRAALAVARQRARGRLIAVFQPHLYSRTQFFLEEFADSFGPADLVIFTDIYPAREAPIPGVTGEALAKAAVARQPGKEIRFISPKEAIAAELAALARPGDLVLTVGAGNVDSVAKQLLEILLS